MKQIDKATQKQGYRFTGNSVGVHTKIPMVVRAVDFLADENGTWPNEYRVHVYATIGDNGGIGAQHIEFRMTNAEALAADIIERVE